MLASYFSFFSVIALILGATGLAEPHAPAQARPKRAVELETPQSISKVTRNATGLVVTWEHLSLKKMQKAGIVDPETFGDAWKEDRTNLIWGDVVRKKDGLLWPMTAMEAQEYCKNLGARLPTSGEFHALSKYFETGPRGEYQYQVFSKFPGPQDVPNPSDFAYERYVHYPYFLTSSKNVGDFHTFNINKGSFGSNSTGLVRCVVEGKKKHSRRNGSRKTTEMYYGETIQWEKIPVSQLDKLGLNSHNFGLAWKESRTGLIWSDLAQDSNGIPLKLNRSEASKLCQEMGARLPTVSDLRLFRRYMGGTPDSNAVVYGDPEWREHTPKDSFGVGYMPQVLVFFEGGSTIWTEQVNNEDMAFNEKNGKFLSANRTTSHFRCVFDPSIKKEKGDPVVKKTANGSEFHFVSQDDLYKQYKLQNVDGFAPAWRAPDGLVWGNPVRAKNGEFYVTQEQAAEKCKSIGARLPTLKEYYQLAKYMGATSIGGDEAAKGYTPQILSGLKEDRIQPYWTQTPGFYKAYSSYSPGYTSEAGYAAFDFSYGNVFTGEDPFNKFSFRCVVSEGTDK